MLQVLKHSDTSKSRSQFQEHCQELLIWGKKANLSGWVELLETAKSAIACEENAYLPCGTLIIKEIKDAGELIARAKATEIAPSEQLQALARASEATWEEFDTSWQRERQQTTPPDPWETQKFKPSKPQTPEIDPHRTIPSSSKIDSEELIEIFAEDDTNSSEELNFLEEDPATASDNSEDIQDLFNNFYTDDTQTGEIEESEATEELISIFELQKETSETYLRKFLPVGPVYFYEQFSELEQLIEQPIVQTTATLYAELEALLGITPTLISPEELPVISRMVTSTSQITSTRSSKGVRLEQTMRVPVKQLDNINNLIGELVVKRNRLEEDQERLRQFLDNLLSQVQKLTDVNSRMQYLYERTLLEKALLASRSQSKTPSINYLPQGESNRQEPESGLNPYEMDSFSQFHPLSQEIIELIVRVRESTSDIQYLVDETDQVARSLRQVTTSLQEGLNNSRMVAFSNNADRMLRGVREISLKLKKKVEVIVLGREVLIDKMILDQLYNPLTHLANNAITHGIELPEVRKARGKNPQGEIKIQAFLQGNQTVISVSDNGAGIDISKVKAKAIERGLINKEKAKNMANQEIYELLFHPGFTTKDKADDFSGRGVGLDVVRTSLQPIRGTVSVDSVLGKGTTFTIRLPLTLSICKALPCLSNNARIAFPIDGVEDTKDYRPDAVKINEQGQKCIPWNNQLLPFQPLSSLFSYNRQISRSTIYGGQEYDDNLSIIVLRGAGSVLAIQVDKIFPEQEIVIKQIEGPIPKPAGIAGATVLGDGRIMPIGDVMELIEIAQGRRSIDHNLVSDTTYSPQIPKPPKTSEPIVLIVDDSITVRQLLSLSFNKAGYRVEEARDGQEAWEKLRSGLPCDLVFCDIEMPRMNGLKLLSLMQQDHKLRDVPVALLTSRGAERHRKVAAELGASGYLTKPYTEKDLLDAAKRMIGGEKLLGPKGNITTAHTTPPSQKTESIVLIIDDSVVVREMLSITFKKSGYHVEQARDGQEAWERLRSGLPTQLIFCDIEMPRMNGLELLSRLQEDPHLSSIPVAMITSRGAERHRKIAAELGAKAYFTKPYIEEELLDAAKRMIQGEVFLENEESGS
ncbi:response regulator [Gloeocapsa sp. PCC 73106]|uniref:hybrid sensor histidine kinase/response regulator n=1 Tax=Gloeocapsa sp. PCC 73106 TaxID=102232 RepID=UPI0002AC64D8|nr:chemotaxis protein histidine kinase-like protein [Gloeocapsa sp. PCC 73106]